MGTPLTELALPELGPLLPSEPAADVFAPGNGVISANPLCVKMKIPRLGVAGSVRSSKIHSFKSGLNTNRLFSLEIILDAQKETQSSLRITLVGPD
jgi:hypothetical protein